MSTKQLSPPAMKFAQSLSAFDEHTISQIKRLVEALREEQTRLVHPVTNQLKAVASPEDFLRLLKEYAPH